jgi:hypothetical protein
MSTETIHGMQFTDLDDRQRFILTQGTPELLAASQRFVTHYNATRSDSADPLEFWHFVDFVANCTRYALNPDGDVITAYVSQGKLVFIPSIETYQRRCATTGQLIGAKRYTRVRDGDRVLLAVAEVIRYQQLPDGKWMACPYTNEVNVAHWQNFHGKGAKKSPWNTTPESQALVGALRGAYRMAFADELRGMADLGADAPSNDDTEREADQADPNVSSPRSRPPAAQAAAAALRGESEAAPTTPEREVAPVAPAPSTSPAPQAAPTPAPAPQAQADPDPESPAEPYSRAPGFEDVYEEAKREGLSPDDLHHLLWRCGWAEAANADALTNLPGPKLGPLRGRVIPAGMATRQQWEECETLREAFLGLPNHGLDGWLRLVKDACGLPAYDARWLKAAHADDIIELAEAAVRQVAA